MGATIVPPQRTFERVLSDAIADHRITVPEARAIVDVFEDRREDQRNTLRQTMLTPDLAWAPNTPGMIFDRLAQTAEERQRRAHDALAFWARRPGSEGGLATESAVGLQLATTSEDVVAVTGVVQPNGPLIAQTYWTDDRGHTNGPGDPAQETEDVVVADGTNACASLAAAQMMAQFGLFATEEAVDASLRGAGPLGSSLLATVDHLRANGLEAELRSGGTWEELRLAIAQGFGVLLTDATPHTFSVFGTFIGSDGFEYARCMTPDGYRDVRREWLERSWQRQTTLAGSLDTGIGGAYIIAGRREIPARAGGDWAQLNAVSSFTVLDGVQSFAAGARRVGRGDVGTGTVQLLGGLVELVVQAPAAILQASGGYLETQGRAGLEWAAAAWQRGGASAFLAAVVYLFAAIAAGLGTALRYLGQIGGFMTSLLGRAMSAPFRAIANGIMRRSEALQTLRHADPNGTLRERAYWRQLVNTPVVPGKQALLQTLLSGAMDEQTRAMATRLLNACNTSETAELRRHFAGNPMFQQLLSSSTSG